MTFLSDSVYQKLLKCVYFLIGYCRYNLDPEGRRSDDELWEALDIVNMKETIKYMSGQLGLLSTIVHYHIVECQRK